MYDISPLYPALAAHLTAQVSAISGREIGFGDSVIPETPAGSVTPLMPYGIVYRLAGSRFTGSQENPYEDINVPVQVTSAGESASQALALGDRVRGVLFSGPKPVVSGMVVMHIEPDGGPSAADKGGERLYTMAETYRFHVTPA